MNGKVFIVKECKVLSWIDYTQKEPTLLCISYMKQVPRYLFHVFYQLLEYTASTEYSLFLYVYLNRHVTGACIPASPIVVE